jgi:U3 small nucleolar RNA-associated protein 21
VIYSRRCIYEFPQVYSSPITCLSQSPVIDVVAIGTLDGSIHIHNIKLDQEIMCFKQDGKVTCISFRTDEYHHMASASLHGDIAIWDMDKKRLFHMLKGAHDSLVVSAEFLNGQPLMITAGSDNSVKVSVDVAS